MGMTNEELLEALNKRFDIIDARLEKIESDVAELKEDVAELKEEHSITRDGVNKLLEWSETAGYIIHFPLDKAK